MMDTNKIEVQGRIYKVSVDHTSCSTPTTAASAHCGCETKADSTSAVPILCPLHIHMGKITQL
jgi:hypothetical protein